MNNTIHIIKTFHHKLDKGLCDLETFKKDFLFQKEIINFYNNIANNHSSCDLSGKDIIILYLFIYFDFADEMKEVSICLLSCLNKYIESQCDADILSEILIKYAKKYKEWKEEDIKNVVRNMTEMYWELELILKLNKPHLSNDELNYYEQQKDFKQKKLIDRMKTLDNLLYFNSYTPIVFDDIIVNQIKETIHKAFWDSIKQSLPSIDKILELFKEIREKLTFLVPKNHKMLELYDEIIDIDFIKQLHDLGEAGPIFWYNKCYYFSCVLNEIDSEYYQSIHKKKWKELNDTFDECKNANEKYILSIDYLTYFIERLHELEEIKKIVIGNTSN